MSDLQSIVGARHVRQDPEPWRLADAADPAFLPARADWLVAPGTADEVAAVLAWCAERGIPVTPRGGGTGLAGGAVPEVGLVLSLGRLRQIRTWEPERRRGFLEAGLRTAEVARLARENGLIFGPDPGAAESSELGGNVATNAGGPHSYGYGPTRAWVTGLEVVVPPGEILALGGPLRRDAAGLDLVGLVTGSEGSLAIVTAAWVALRAAPEHVIAVRARLPDTARGAAAVERVVEAGLPLTVLDFVDEATPGAEGAFTVLAEAAGSAEHAEATAADLGDLLADGAVERLDPDELWRWRSGLTGRVVEHLGSKLSEDVGVPVERLGEAVAGVREIGARHDLAACSWGHAGDGILHASFLFAKNDREARGRASAGAEEVFALALDLGGTPSGEHGTGRLKRAWRPRAQGPAVAALHARVKAAWDPESLLNPGVG